MKLWSHSMTALQAVKGAIGTKDLAMMCTDVPRPQKPHHTGKIVQFK